MRASKASAWAGKSSKTFEGSAMRNGYKIPWKHWAKEEGLKGFHERMPARLDQQYLANWILEVEEGLRKGEYKL